MSFTAMFAQQDACIQEVRNIYKKYSEAGSVMLKENKSCHMNYVVRTVTEDSIKDGITESAIEMHMSKGHLQVKSSQMEVYQDEQDAFVVLPIKKMVLRTDPDTRTDIEKRTNRLKFIQDTLFSMSKVTVCKTVSNKGNTNKRIVMEVNEMGMEMTSIKRITFDLNTKTNQFERVRIEYSPYASGLPNRVVSAEYTFHAFAINDANQQKEKVAAIFMASANTLNKKYTGYTLVDNRKKVNKIPQ